MITIPDTLRDEYNALKQLRLRAEQETESEPVETIYELSNALDHLMRSTEDDAEHQIQQARAHFVRAGRDLYFLLLTSKLDRLQAVSPHLRSEDLVQFRHEYQKIRDAVQTARSNVEKIESPSAYLRSLEEVDAYLDKFEEIEVEVAAKRKLMREKYKHVLIAILSALLGAVVSLLVGMLMK